MIIVVAFWDELSSPFFEALLLHLGIDTASWVDPMLNLFPTHSFQVALAALSGAALGAWMHWAAARYDERSQEKGRNDDVFTEHPRHTLGDKWTGLYAAAENARLKFIDHEAAKQLAKVATREQEIEFFATLLHKFGEVHGCRPPSQLSEYVPFDPERLVIMRLNATQMDSQDSENRQQYRYLHIKSDTLSAALVDIKKYLDNPPREIAHPVLQLLPRIEEEKLS